MKNVDIYGDNELIYYLNSISNELKPNLVKGLNEASQLVEQESKRKFGTYQRGWPKLKRDSVLAKYKRKSALTGINNSSIIAKSLGMADDPLILTGALRDSIDHEVDALNLEATIFSDNEYAAIHEYGYGPKNIPARSFLRLTLWDEENNIVRIIDNKVGDSL